MEQAIINNTTESTDARMFSETVQRAATASVSNINETERTVELSFASEFEVSRWYGVERLEMTSRAADLNRLNNGGALLSEHNRSRQIGKVIKAWVGDDKRAHAVVKFSRKKEADDEFQDVIDGIRTCISFGYRVLEYRHEKAKGNAPDKYTATRWEAMEISLVSIPADPTIGVGRSSEETQNFSVEDNAPVDGQSSVREETQAATVPASKETEKAENRGSNITMSEERKPDAGTEFTREADILSLGKMFGAEDLARSFAADPNKSIDDLRTALQARYTPQEITPAQPAASEVGLNERETKQYSIVRALRAQADGNWKGAEFERECSDAVAEQLGRSTGGFFVPMEVQNRDLSIAGGQATGGALVGTDHLAGSFIELLRSNMVALKLGVRVMSGLVGDVQIPRQDGSAQVYWVDEGEAPAESDPSFGQLELTPKTMGAVTQFTRKLLLQSSPSVEQLVWADIAAIMAREKDRVIFDGSGINGQPRGVLNTTGVVEVPGTGTSGIFTYADAVAMETAIAEGNAPDATAYVMRPGVLGILKTRPMLGDTYPVYLVGADGKLNGYRAEKTTNFPADTILFGDFSQVIVGEWGVLEIEANRLGTGFRAGNVEVRALESMDVAVRYPQAFKKNEDVS